MARHILSVLNNVLPQQHAWKMQVLHQWERIIGPLATKVTLYRIDDRAVVLAVNHPGLAQELLMLSDLIKTKINAVIGSDTITAIHFRTTAKQTVHTPAPITTTLQKPIQSLTSSEKKHLDIVENTELRIALTNFYLTCKQRTTS